MKIGLLFPGQGAQYVGMGKELYENYGEARDVFDKANAVLGFDLKKIVFEGPEETLRQTQYTQPAIFVTSVAAFKVFSTLFPLTEGQCLCAGHSLGEYSALAAANVFTLEQGLGLVKARGEYIQKVSENNPGTMAAILGLDIPVVKELCAKASAEAVNFNSAGQIVIAGTAEAVQKAIVLAQEAGATKAIPLSVSGPFHSSLMTPASEMMKEELAKTSLAAPRFPVITNCDAQLTTDAQSIAGKLTRQINSPVLWEDSVKLMIAQGTDTFIEIGPGRVLSGLMRRIDKTKRTMNIEDKKSLDKTIESLKS